MWKNIKDTLALSHIASTYCWSNIVSFPNGDRYQVNLTTFVKCLSMPKNSIGNVFIIQGGIKHFNSNSYYIKTTCSLLSKSLRIFIFEKIYPVCNPEFAHDVADCLDLIKKDFPGPTCVIGYSMGGLLLFTYLSFGYDQADLYIPVCCPLNMDRFLDVITNNYLFKLLYKKACQSFQVNSYEDLLILSGTSKEKNKNFEEHFAENLNKTSDKWIDKTIYILSENDPLTSLDDINLLNQRPTTYFINGGWHCCIESILLSTKLAERFIKNVNVKAKDLDVNYGVLDVIKK
jgi:hypothetical protein